jgi:hypothetical protein
MGFPTSCGIAAGLQGGSSAAKNPGAMALLIPRSGLPVRALAVSLLALLPVTGAAAQATQPAAAASRPAPPAARPPAPAATEAPPEIITDPAQLPAPVARMRARMLEAARSGDLDKLFTVMQSNETMPVFSFGNERDPVAFWKSLYPDSQGLEVMAILIQILETGFVRVERKTPQDMYVWPYFARMPLAALTPEQKVELFRIVTGADYQEMLGTGGYTFYRIGIAPDGTWHFFVAGQ